MCAYHPWIVVHLLLGRVYMIPEYVPRLHGSHFTGMIRSFMRAFVLTSHFGALLPIDRHSATRPSQLGHSSRTGTKPRTSFTWCRYGMWSDFIPVRMHVSYSELVSVSCKRIQRYKWAPGWTRTGMKLVVPVSCKHPLIQYCWQHLSVFSTSLLLRDSTQSYSRVLRLIRLTVLADIREALRWKLFSSSSSSSSSSFFWRGGGGLKMLAPFFVCLFAFCLYWSFDFL